MRPLGAVRVTAGHIATGRRGNPHGCAIALAISGACAESQQHPRWRPHGPRERQPVGNLDGDAAARGARVHPPVRPPPLAQAQAGDAHAPLAPGRSAALAKPDLVVAA